MLIHISLLHRVPNENYDYSPFTVRQAQQNRLYIRGVRNWFAVPTTPPQEQASNEKDKEKEKTKKEKDVPVYDSMVTKSLNPNVSTTEEKEYKR